MDERISLPYGDGKIEIDVRGAASIKTVLPNPMQEITDLPAAFLHSVEEGAVGVTLKDAVGPDDPVTIVVSDITRSWMHADKVMPLLVDYLHSRIGLPYENMVILIANGTHRGQSKEEREKICSKEVVGLVRVEDHDCDAPDLVCVGKTTRGTSVLVNPLVVGRKVIIVGGTVHHVMAGFGGGRKNILPGVSGRQTIKENHCRALDPVKPHTDERVGPRKLKDNPIHEDMVEAEHLVHVDFGVNLVVAPSGVHSGIFSGDPDAAWEASCAYAAKSFEVEIPLDADVILCSSGGYPKDINLYQGCKGMLNVVNALKPGGTLFWACQCREGGGQAEYFDWLTPLKEGRLEPALREGFTIDGYIFFLTVESAARAARTCLLTELDPGLIEPMGLTASSRPEDLLDRIDFTDKKVYVIPYGQNVVPV